ncbi:MAG TPA: helix-turn-helix domain-containing protein [Dyadobacter sp.]|nr:helix-turn-helix domain-containing protein [Dyadobacter sp.]
MNSNHEAVILVSANDAVLQRLGRDVLKKNHQVIEIHNGEEALTLARKIRPEVLLCDIEFPMFGGIDICEKLKADTATNHMSVILHGPPANQMEGLLAGADDYIVSPLDDGILGLRIENLIRMRKALRSQISLDPGFQSVVPVMDGAFLERLRELVIENISNPEFGVHDIAFQAGISVSVLYRKLRLATGITVNDFVKSLRMQRAMQLLQTRVYPVNEVAAAVGFEDSKYFSKEFRKTYGIRPTEIRRRIVER